MSADPGALAEMRAHIRTLPPSGRLGVIRGLLAPGAWQRCRSCRGSGRRFEPETPHITHQQAVELLESIPPIDPNGLCSCDKTYDDTQLDKAGRCHRCELQLRPPSP